MYVIYLSIIYICISYVWSVPSSFNCVCWCERVPARVRLRASTFGCFIGSLRLHCAPGECRERSIGRQRERPSENKLPLHRSRSGAGRFCFLSFPCFHTTWLHVAFEPFFFLFALDVYNRSLRVAGVESNLNVLSPFMLDDDVIKA